MIQHPHIHDFSRSNYLLGHADIRIAGLKRAAGMVVHQDDGGSLLHQGFPQDFPR